MQLSKKERLSFIYQLRILEALYPDDADYYSKHRTALEEGYSLHYDWLFEHLYEELSEEACREVLDILDMYRFILYGVDKLAEDDQLRQHHLARFPGFDGNHETHLMAYARYFIVDLERFSELSQSEYPYFNSHAPMLPTYRQMLRRWHALPSKYELGRAEIANILGV